MNMLKAFSQELEALVARTAPAVVGVEHRRGHGSGVVLAKDGYVLTNSHVVQGVSSVRVRRSGGDSIHASVVGADDRTDLAVLRTDGVELTALPFAAPGDAKVGQLVLAIGNPLRFERSVSLGVISAIDRHLPGPRGGLEGLVQTDAAINPGNSGGPLLDMEGHVVGINTAIIPFAQGMGFAIPSQTASWVAAVLIQRGAVKRPYLGIAAIGEELGSEVAQAAGQGRALRVIKVSEASPASEGGLRDGDLVLSADGQKLGSVDDLQRTMVLSPSRELNIDVWRKGHRQVLSVRPERESLAA